MGTQMSFAREGIITTEMRRVAQREGRSIEFIRREIAEGRLVVPANRNHLRLGLDPMGIGKNIRCKVNVNFGTSPVAKDLQSELLKLEVSLKYGADTVMDLSTGGNLKEIRQKVIEHSPVPVGTVPIYEMVKLTSDLTSLSEDDMIDVIEAQAAQGVDYMTIHAGLLKEFIPLAQRRITKIVSRGGGLIAHWMMETGRQNPLYTKFDKICEIFKRYDVTFSLGDGLRPGCTRDASDEAQLAELKVLGELTLKAWRHGVQVMIEGPGHIPFHQIAYNMEIQERVCHGAPFYILGPLVTDIAAGYDHLASSIGATAGGFFGAALLCYITPKEHLGLPDEEDVKQGLIAYKIAAHAADLARGLPGAGKWDDEMSRARYAFNWLKQYSLSVDPQLAKSYHDETLPGEYFESAEFCSMCGPKFCPMATMAKIEKKSAASRPTNEPVHTIA